MSTEDSARVNNTITGGIQFGPVLQGRDIHAAIHLPSAAPIALAQLPARVADFTGRETDLAMLANLLDSKNRKLPGLVTAVMGLAGVGKTALVVEAGYAALQRGCYGGGVLFIDLHGYDDQPTEPGQALDALLRALGISAEHIPSGLDERTALYRSVLAHASDPVLVVADNASSEAQIRPLLPGTGPHTVLVTSRHTLAGLNNARLVEVGTLDESASVGLLDAALRTARPEDDRIALDHEAAAWLAVLCGGLPLALHIAAALLKADLAFGPDELASELAVEHQRLERLRYDDGNGPAGLSVAAAFELSYRKLDESHAKVFRLLPVNTGPDISTAACAALTLLPTGNARTILSELARAHLVEISPGASGRWRMHDLILLYARQLSDKHADGDRRDRVIGWLLSYYQGRAQAADKHLRGVPRGAAVLGDFSSQADALAWLDSERESLVAAVSMAAATGRDRIAWNLPVALARYLHWRRRFDDLLAVLITSLAASRRLGDRRAEGGALNSLGLAFRNLGLLDDAVAALQAAAAIFRETDERSHRVFALVNLGLTLQDSGRLDEAVSACRTAADLSREIGDRDTEGSALNNLGMALRAQKELTASIIAHGKAAAIFLESGNRNGEGEAQHNLGISLRQDGQLERSAIALHTAAEICRKTGDRHGEGMALNSLGLTMREQHKFHLAVTAHRQSATIFEEIGDQSSQSKALNNLRLSLRALKQYPETAT